MLIDHKTFKSLSPVRPEPQISMHICQTCGEQDEFLMTFESRNITTRWLCSSCYWKAIAQHAYSAPTQKN